jgi:1,6-anhydro-N-acetylmuramate kinase
LIRGALTRFVADDEVLSRSTIRRAENTELSLVSLEAIVEIRHHLDQLEAEAISSARDKGATVEDIAGAMGITTQAIYHRLKNGGQGAKRGRPKAAGSAS